MIDGFLGEMLRGSRERAATARALATEHTRRAAHQPPSRALRLSRRPAVIAEIKRASPAVGPLAPACDAADRAAAYQAAGASAVSVLTEPSRFQGSLEDLAAVRRSVDLPVMRKDFLCDPAQLLEARAHGADGVLLIAAMLEGGLLEEMLTASHELGLFALVETFDEQDIARANAACTSLIGVNSRDLRTLKVDFARFARLRGLLPKGARTVAESGIDSPERLREVLNLGYDAALIGGALMASANPARRLEELCRAS